MTWRMPAWHVEWHMREARRPLLFSDTELEDGIQTRDRAAPARRPESAGRKVRGATLDDGTPAHRSRTLVESLETITRNPDKHAPAATFEVTTQADAKQQRAVDLAKYIGGLSRPATRL